MQPVDIRRARADDADSLPDIERSAGELFRLMPGLEWIAAAAVPTATEHRLAIASTLVWVADSGAAAVGFLRAEAERDALHIGEVSVHRDWQGQKIGSRLIAVAVGHARDAGSQSVTLTTFADVPWNAPYYERIGFVRCHAADDRLTSILADEVARGFVAETRCAMRMILT
jgi:predicted N-acetyltransferase YhbS